MIIRYNITLFVLLLTCLNLWAKCEIPDPKLHHMQYFSLPDKQEFVELEKHLNADGDIDLVLTTKEQCGSKGCEFSFYKAVGSDCYSFLGDLSGKLLSISDQIFFGSKIVVMQTGDGHLSRKQIITYYYDSLQKAYVPTRGR